MLNENGYNVRFYEVYEYFSNITISNVIKTFLQCFVYLMFIMYNLTEVI
ncbi:hypothetical protein OPLHCY645_00090 [Clostridium tetani]